MAVLKVGGNCNNNCVFCDDLLVKARFEKSLSDIKSELAELRKTSDRITLPCNADCRSDFFKIVEYAKSLGFSISLQTNARMFNYSDFANKAAENISDIKVIYSQSKNASQVLQGLKNIKKKDIVIPINRKNCQTLIESIRTLNSQENVKVLITNPHPAVYESLKGLSVIDRPFELKFELTAKCNMDCEFCFNQNSFGRSLPDLPISRVKDIIDRIAAFGVKRIRFTGGEPFLRSDFIDILKHAKKLGLHVLVNTNGTLVGDVSRLKGLVDEVLLPFHSLDEQYVKEKFALARALQDAGIFVSLNTVLTKENIDSLDEFVLLFENLEIDWFLARPVPNEKNPMPMTNEQVELVIEKLISLRNKLKDGRINIDSIPYCAYDPEKVAVFSRGAAACGVFNKLVVGPEGKVKPCYSISQNLGSIDLLETAWKDSLSSEIRHLETFPVTCKNCKYLYDCLGGCRFAAKLADGSYDSMDSLAKPEIFLK
jgi:radical SAM protein with 4Fe4S-binding SPASM domain